MNCRHCELALKRIQGWNPNLDLSKPYLDNLTKKTRSKRILGMIEEAYALGMARGIMMVDNGHNKIEPPRLEL